MTEFCGKTMGHGVVCSAAFQCDQCQKINELKVKANAWDRVYNHVTEKHADKNTYLKVEREMQDASCYSAPVFITVFVDELVEEVEDLLDEIDYLEDKIEDAR